MDSNSSLDIVDNLVGCCTPEFLSWFRAWIATIDGQEDFPISAFLFDYSEFEAPLSDTDRETLAKLLATNIIEIMLNLLTAELVIGVSPTRPKPIPTGTEHRVKALASIFLYLKETFSSTRQLSHAGFDLSARIVARSVFEATDLAVVLTNDEQLAGKWISSQDDARDFWHKNLSGKKLSKLRDKALSGGMPNTPHPLQELISYRRNEAEVFSMAVHPAYQAGVMTVFQTLESMPFETDVSSEHFNYWYSLRTLGNLVVSLGPAMFFVLAKGLQELELYEAKQGLPAENKTPLVRALFEGLMVSDAICTTGLNSEEVDRLVRGGFGQYR